MTRATSPESGLDLQRTETVRRLAEQHADERGALMVVLHAVQSEVGHIDRSDVEAIADALNLSIADVHGVVSFYKDFRTEPSPEHTARPGQEDAHVAGPRDPRSACRARGARRARRAG